jgi:predicted nucleic acid-binding protein
VVAVDTSTVIAYVQGESGLDVERFDAALAASEAFLPPVVLTELLSEPNLPQDHRRLALSLPNIEITNGYWIRAAALRSALLAQKLRARLPDSLIAQSCIDHDMPLITRDQDFRHFVEYYGLRLA